MFVVSNGNSLKREKLFLPPAQLLRFLFVIALFRVRTILVQLSKQLGHVFHFVPNIKTHIDRRALLGRRSRGLVIILL